MKTIKQILLAVIAVLVSTIAFATNVTLKVIDSGGNPISGVTINIHKSNCCSLPALITDGNGEATVDLANYTFGTAGYVFTARLDYSSAAYAQAITSADEGTTIHTFQTAEARMQVTNCNGDPLVGIPLTYFISNSGGGTMGSTDANGFVTKELFTGTYSFRAFVNKTRKYVNVDISGSGVDYTYIPTQINFTFSGTISIYQPNIGGTLITPGIYLFPGTYNFKFAQSGHPTFYQEIAVSGCDMTKSVTRIEFLSSTGAPISGGVVRYWDYGNWRSAGLENGGVTDANGIVFGDLPAGVTRYRMSYYNTSNEVISTTSYVNFATINMEAELLSSSNAPLANGKAFFWGYGNWRLIGTTDATGKTNREVLSGNYKLRMDYKYTTTTSAVISWTSSATHTFNTTKAEIKLETCNGVPLAGGNSKYWAYGNWRPMVETSTGYYTQEILTGDQQSFNFSTAYKYFGNKHVHDVTTGAYTFVTTNVSLQWSGTIKYWSFGNHRPFTQPSMELLPGNYTFEFYSTGNPMFTMPITVSGCSMSNTVAVMRLIDSQGDGLAGGVGKYYKSGWKSAGTTDANGNILLLSSTLSGNIPFRMYWKGGSQQISQNITTNSTVVFQTELATAQLNNSGGTDLSATFKYYASGWKTFGSGTATTLASMELLPINYPFRVYYAGASLQKSQNISADKDVVFATEAVTAELNDHNGADLDAKFKYYASGWKTFGSGTPTVLASMELLPLNYPFRVYYAGASLQKSQNVSIDNSVDFATTLVTAELNDHNGADLDAKFKYYASGWKTFGSGTPTVLADMELLPLNYPFRVYYGGASLQKSQNVSTDNSVDFATVLVTNSLTDCDGTGIAADFKYYASGWKTFGTSTAMADATLELLPINYPFRVYLNGASIQKSQNVSSNTFVDFTATNVTLTYPGMVKYYASGWKLFKDNTTSSVTMAMLPKTYPFRFYNGTSSIQKNLVISGCAINGGVITLVDENGNALANYPADYSTETRNLKFKYRCGGSWAAWTNFQTDANGQVFYNINCANNNWDGKITMVLNQTSLEQDVSVNPVFAAAKVNVNLETCDGLITDAPGGGVSQGGGYWYYHGATGSTGTVSIFTFPTSNLKLKMGYNHGTQTVYSTIVSGTNNIDFTTSAVTLINPNGGILSNKGGSWWTFTQPTMNLLPGVYNFKFYTGSSWTSLYPLTVSECSHNAALLTVVDQNGNGVPGGVARPATGGSWNSNVPGVTDANGHLFAELPTGYTKIKMTVNQTSFQQTVAQLNTSNFTWVTGTATVQVNDNDGNPISGVTIKQGGGYWYSWGNTDANGQLMIPTFTGQNVKLEACLNNSSMTVIHDNSTNHIFQTGKVMRDMIYSGTVKASIGGSWNYLWPSVGSSAQLFAGSYNFVYSGAPNEIVTVVAGATNVIPLAVSASKRDETSEEASDFDVKLGVYPNPFSDVATFSFELEETSVVKIVIYDLSGKIIRTIANGEYSQGTNQVLWNGNTDADAPASAGVYFYRIEAGNNVTINRIILSR